MRYVYEIELKEPRHLRWWLSPRSYPKTANPKTNHQQNIPMQNRRCPTHQYLNSLRTAEDHLAIRWFGIALSSFVTPKFALDKSQGNAPPTCISWWITYCWLDPCHTVANRLHHCMHHPGRFVEPFGGEVFQGALVLDQLYQLFMHLCVCAFVYVWLHEIISKNMFVNRNDKICLMNSIYRFPTSGFGDSRATQLSMQENWSIPIALNRSTIHHLVVPDFSSCKQANNSRDLWEGKAAKKTT